jgi:hypothetical protein
MNILSQHPASQGNPRQGRRGLARHMVAHQWQLQQDAKAAEGTNQALTA